MKIKKKFWKIPEERNLTCRGGKIRITSNFSLKTMQARKEIGMKYLYILLRTKKQPGILYPVKFFFKNKGEIKTFSDKIKLRKFVASRPVLQEVH